MKPTTGFQASLFAIALCVPAVSYGAAAEDLRAYEAIRAVLDANIERALLEPGSEDFLRGLDLITHRIEELRAESSAEAQPEEPVTERLAPRAGSEAGYECTFTPVGSRKAALSFHLVAGESGCRATEDNEFKFCAEDREGSLHLEAVRFLSLIPASGEEPEIAIRDEHSVPWGGNAALGIRGGMAACRPIDAAEAEKLLLTERLEEATRTARNALGSAATGAEVNTDSPASETAPSLDATLPAQAVKGTAGSAL